MKKQDGYFVMACHESYQNNLDQHVNILNGKYFNFNFKCMGKTFNKLNKLILTTNTCNNNNNNNNDINIGDLLPNKTGNLSLH